MTITLWCAPDVHLAIVDEDVVALDVAADRYDCLIAAAKTMAIDPGGAIETNDLELAEALLEAGIAVAESPGQARLPQIPARRECTSPAGLRGRDIAWAMLVLLTGTLTFRGQSLSALTTRDRRVPPRPTFSDEGRLAALVGAVRKARPWVPFEGQCLQRSFLLRRFLASHDIATDWIFGVRTTPFSAHCWLQIGDLVVGDRLARIVRYTPILRT